MKLQKQKTEKQIIGQIGENAVSKYIQNKGYKVIARNYLKKWGEIDVVAEKQGVISFIEVKSISRETKYWNVTHIDSYRAEDNIHPMKLKRPARTIETYLIEHNVSDSKEWKCLFAVVFVDQKEKLCKIDVFEEIVL